MNGLSYGLPAIAMTLTLMASQPVSAQTTAIQGIQVVQVDNSLEIRIQVPLGSVFETSVSSSGQQTVIDITNSQLQLAEGESFFQEFPVPEIISVSAAEENIGTVQIVLVGTEGAPSVQVMQFEGGILIGVLDVGEDVVTSLSDEPSSVENQAESGEPQGSANQTNLDGSPTNAGEELAEGEVSEPSETTQADQGQATDGGEFLDGEFVFSEFVVDADRFRFLVPDASTATRTDTPIRDTPLSIQVVPREVIESQGATRLSEALNNVSGVNPGNTTDGADEFRIRGFEVGTVARNGFRESLFLDRSSPRDSANIEQVEVLSGPSAILFGSLDAGGTINLITKQPQFEQFIDVSFLGGSFSTFRPEIDFNYPLTEDGSLRSRFNVAYENSESFREFTSIERFFFAPSITWDISDRTRVNFNGEYLYDDRPFDRGLVAFGENVADIPIGRRLGNPFDQLITEEFRAGYEFEHDFSDDWQIRNAFFFTSVDRSRINTNPGELDESTGILTRTFFDSDPESFQTFLARLEVDGEFNTGSAIEHQLIAGVEWSLQTRDNTVSIATAPSINIFDPEYQGEGILNRVTGSPIIDVFTRAENLGFYVQDSINFSDTVFVLVGGRLEVISDTNTDFIFDTEQSFETTEFIPQAGIVYKPIESVSLYGSFAESFRSNTLALINNAELVEPEESRQFEVGIKADFLDGNLSTTLAAFHITRQNELAPDPDNPNFQVPIGETRSQGIELSLTGEPMSGWDIIASYTFTDTEIIEDESITEGNRFENVPLHRGRIWTTYEIQTGSLSGLAFGLGFTAVGEREGDVENSFQLDPYAVFDAAVFYRRDDFDISLNFNNIFDVRYISSAGTRTSITPGAPFEFRGTVSWRF